MRGGRSEYPDSVPGDPRDELNRQDAKAAKGPSGRSATPGMDGARLRNLGIRPGFPRSLSE